MIFGATGATLGAILVLLLSHPAASPWESWSERRDLNSRPPVPQTGALTELRYAPTLRIKHLVAIPASTKHELPPVCRPRYRIS